MAMGKRKAERQQPLWVAYGGHPAGPKAFVLHAMNYRLLLHNVLTR